MKDYTQTDLQQRMLVLGLHWPIDPHVVAVRSNKDTPDAFDDVAYSFITKTPKRYTITTNPGTYWLQNFLNPGAGGTAVLADDRQYIFSWKKGMHHGKPAFVQMKPVLIFRDANKDTRTDESGEPVWGMYGINLHRAGKKSVLNLKWSAGCQVWANEDEFEDFLNDCDLKRVVILPAYTLLKEF